MNQILVTKRLYITPELKKKKKLYKINLFISVFLLFMLCSFYIYAEYDRNKEEEVSQEILSDVLLSQQKSKEDKTTVSLKKNEALIIVISNNEETEEQEIIEIENNKNTSANLPSNENLSENEKMLLDGKYTASNGKEYSICGIVNIPKINVTYPILSETTDSLLKVSVCKFWGADPNKVGNCCIVGHNYRNKRFFSKVPTLVCGDIVEITDLSNKTLEYEVYDIYTVTPEDVSCTSQLTNGRKEITLITCTNDSSARVIVKAKEVK